MGALLDVVWTIAVGVALILVLRGVSHAVGSHSPRR